MVEVEGGQEFEAWFLILAEKDAEAVARVVGLLEEKGVSLGFPYTSDIKGSPRSVNREFNRAGIRCEFFRVRPVAAGRVALGWRQDRG